jgi:hypothetical protein
LQATGTTCQWRRGQTRRTTRNPAECSDWDASDLQEQGRLGAHLAREPSAFPHQTEQVTKLVTTRASHSISPTHTTTIYYTHPRYHKIQTSDQDYITHDNKRKQTTAISKTTNQNNTINQNHRRQHGEKGREKRPNKKLNGNFIFDERTYFNELDQSTPLSDNYKNSEICKH